MTGRPLPLIRRLAATSLLAVASLAMAQPAPPAAPTRGQLLYATHCIECHNSQMHWRARQQARNWATLRLEVWRWQDAASLGWSDADIDEVTRHLNDTIYHFVQPRPTAGSSMR
jgi:mono/diheme cytochrome c family protein